MRTLTFLFVLLLQTNLFFSQNENEFAISAEIFNILYIGVDNPIEIAVYDSKPEDITVETSSGTIKKSGSTTYFVHPDDQGELKLSVFKKNILIGTKSFVCKLTPVPSVYVASYTHEGQIARNVLLAQAGIVAKLDDFMLEVPYTVNGFSLSIISGEDEITKISNSNKFTPQQKELINNARIGSNVVIDKVNCLGPEGLPRAIAPISLIIK
jgi:hypothetical protein